MILHQGDRYVCNGTQVHPGSLNFLKSSLEIGVYCRVTPKMNKFDESHWANCDMTLVNSHVVFKPWEYYTILKVPSITIFCTGKFYDI